MALSAAEWIARHLGSGNCPRVPCTSPLVDGRSLGECRNRSAPSRSGFGDPTRPPQVRSRAPGTEFSMTELEVQAAFSSQLMEGGWVVECQYPLGAKRVDVVAWKNDEVRSFELKLRDWRAAGWQAFLNRPFFTRSFVVLPQNERRRADLDWFEQLGVGLIVVMPGGEHRVVDDAAPSRKSSAVDATLHAGRK